MKKYVASVLAVPLAASMVLAGCSGGADADAAASRTTGSPPTTTTSAAPTTAVAPKTDPNIPAAARAHTTAGAEAFVRYFFERLNVAWTVPEAGILSPLCQASSKSCAASEATAARLTKEGHRYSDDPVTVQFIGTLDATNPDKYEVLANVAQERRSEIDEDGKTYVTDKRKNLRLDFELLYTDKAWSVISIQSMK